MAKTDLERQQACRAKLKARRIPAKAASKRLARLLTDHPEKLAKFNTFMLQMNAELRDEGKFS